MENKAKARQRNRASAACTYCRKSRIRCVVDADDGQKNCVNCRNTGHECIFDDKDGRKSRGSSKAFADGLCQRIEQLENLLQQQGAMSIVPNSESTNDGNGESSSMNVPDAVGKVLSPIDQPPPYNDDAVQAPEIVHKVLEKGPTEPEPDTTHSSKLVRKLVPCPVRFDMASGRVRFFGPTTSMNLLPTTTLDKGMERQESHWPIALLVPDLTPEAHNYLMELFWSCHNSHLHLVHKDAFYDDQERGGTQFYSVFLHCCMLAISVRYASHDRQDIQRLKLRGQISSTLHAKAKSMAKLELERPGGIPSIQALFLLADMECMNGRDDTGWMFAGMSFRLVFDVGLHVDASELQLTERETQIRNMVLWACIINDKYWSLYLGRPTTFNENSMAPSCLSKNFGALISCRPSAFEKSIETRVYEALLQLMELVGPLCDLEVKRPTKTTDAYFKIAALDRELNAWHNDLPDDMKWNPENIAKGPPSLFLLHSQYHTALILLHRPFVNHGDSQLGLTSKDSENERMNHFTMLSRTICTDNAKRSANIFKKYRARFDLTQAFVTGMQHAGTAATALMTEIVIQKNPAERNDLLADLSCLKTTLGLLSKIYQPAILMASVVEHFIRDFRGEKESSSLDSDGAIEEGDAEGRGRNGFSDNDGLPTSSASFNPSISNLTCSTTPSTTYPPSNNNAANNFQKRPYRESSPFPASKRRSTHSHLSTSILTPRHSRCQSPKNLPFLPSSWLEELDFSDGEFLSLLGVEGRAATVGLEGPGGLLSSSCFPGDGDFGALN